MGLLGLLLIGLAFGVYHIGVKANENGEHPVLEKRLFVVSAILCMVGFVLLGGGQFDYPAFRR